MKPVLVTGASGFVGWHVARLLAERGCCVRALVRGDRKIEDLDLETVSGDLRDPASLQKAVRGCGLVFHVAADYRLWAKHPEELYHSNAGGTRNLLEAARQAGVERFVYTSTVGCIGFVEGGEGNEETPVSLADMAGVYKRSKFLAEQVALEFAAQGFPVVIVNPTTPVGERDWKPTPTGKIIVDFLRGKMPAYLDTGLNLVDVRDVAEGHWQACQRGEPGRRYILGAENLTLRQIFERLEALSGRRAPRLQIPYSLAYVFAWGDTAWARLTGREPRAPLDAVRMAAKKMFVSSDRARRELGYQPGPVDAALRRAIEWYRAAGYCNS